MIPRSHRKLPITIFRPSIIVGERHERMDVLVQRAVLAAAAVLARHLCCASRRTGRPCRCRSHRLRRRRDLRVQRHARRGRDLPSDRGHESSTVGELIELATNFFRRPEPQLIDPAIYARVVHPLLLRNGRDERARRRSAKRSVFPVLRHAVHFDDRRARVALRGAGITTPSLELLRPIDALCAASQWGRRRISRASALGHARRRPRPQRTHRTRRRRLVVAR